jgi:hypothetical protein
LFLLRLGRYLLVKWCCLLAFCTVALCASFLEAAIHICLVYAYIHMYQMKMVMTGMRFPCRGVRGHMVHMIFKAHCCNNLADISAGNPKKVVNKLCKIASYVS